MGVWVCPAHAHRFTHYIIFILCSLNNSVQAIGPEINVSVRNAQTPVCMCVWKRINVVCFALQYYYYYKNYVRQQSIILLCYT